MSGGIRNVHIENCVLGGRENAIFIKSREGRGGFIEHVTGENLTVLQSPTFIGIDLLNKGIPATDPVPGDVEKWSRVKDLRFRNIQVQGVAELVAGKNVPAARPVHGLALANLNGTCERGVSLANMTGVKLSGFRVTGYAGPLVTTENVTGSGLDDPTAR
jgi:hypothetical protein